MSTSHTGCATRAPLDSSKAPPPLRTLLHACPPHTPQTPMQRRADEAINALSVAVKESPLNKGKKALARMQAGEYDRGAVRARLEDMLTTKPVSMLFTLLTLTDLISKDHPLSRGTG